MFKQLILSFILASITFAFVVNCSPLDTKFKVFSSVKEENLCCLPPVFSFSMASSSVSVSNQNTLKLDYNTTTSISGDYKRGLIKIDILANINGQQSASSTLIVKTPGYLIYYDINQSAGTCRCNSFAGNELPWYCVKKGQIVNKANIGKYQANRIKSGYLDAWVYYENPSQVDQCWSLSNTVTSDRNVYEEFYYDQVESVTHDAFEIPQNCPTIDVCLTF